MPNLSQSQGHNDPLEAALPAEPELDASLAKDEAAYQLPVDSRREQALGAPGDAGTADGPQLLAVEA